MATPEGSFGASKAAPNRRRPRESPRGSSRQGDGDGLGPSRDPKGFVEEASALEGAPGEWQGLRAAPRSERGFRRASASRGSSKGGKASAERFSKGRPERLRPRCEPWRGAASAGPDPKGSEAGFRSCPSDPTGIGEGLSGLSAETHRVPNGASRPRSGIRRKAKRAPRPPRDPKPPSERWPRHPATAVKAGTSGGRWRHRPPL